MKSNMDISKLAKETFMVKWKLEQIQHNKTLIWMLICMQILTDALTGHGYGVSGGNWTILSLVLRLILDLFSVIPALYLYKKPNPE